MPPPPRITGSLAERPGLFGLLSGRDPVLPISVLAVTILQLVKGQTLVGVVTVWLRGSPARGLPHDTFMTSSPPRGHDTSFEGVDMRRVLAATATAALVLGLAACGGSSGGTSAASSGSASGSASKTLQTVTMGVAP